MMIFFSKHNVLFFGSFARWVQTVLRTTATVVAVGGSEVLSNAPHAADSGSAPYGVYPHLKKTAVFGEETSLQKSHLEG